MLLTALNPSCRTSHIPLFWQDECAFSRGLPGIIMLYRVREGYS